MIQWKKILTSFGFSESDAVVYLTALEMGAASVQDIAKRAKLSRVTTYAVIKTLTDRGLMSSVEKGKKRLFVAESPERLVSFVHGRVKEIEGALAEVQSSMHELKLLQRGEKPIVKMFEGPEALQAIVEDMVTTKSRESIEFGNIDDLRSLYKQEQHIKNYRELEKTQSRKRLIVLVRGADPIIRSPLEQFYVLPTDLDFHGDVIVYGNKVGLSTLVGKQISIIIESEILANTMRTMLDLIWKQRPSR